MLYIRIGTFALNRDFLKGLEECFLHFSNRKEMTYTDSRRTASLFFEYEIGHKALCLQEKK